ncbi:MAG: hypothetical protein M0Q53_05580 [Prolixibacteraceae bacterium]|jgi:hypothetical protein|nr:hypothetical protein [Prolixibacteraceae bacterium]
MNHKAKAKIDNLEKLKIERNKLELYCTFQEKLIGLKIDYFKENYNTLLGRALLPYDPSQNIRVNDLLDSANGLIAGLLPGLFKGKFLPGVVLKLIQILVINTLAKKR